MTENSATGAATTMTRLARLGREARAAQTTQYLRGWELYERTGTSYRLSDTARRLFDSPGVGLVYGLFRADPWSGRDWDTGVVPEARADVAGLVQEAARQASDGIGVLVVEEGAHGLQVLGATMLPTLLGQAATWDTRLVAQTAGEVGRAARADGIHLLLTPGLDLLRDPRWGRSEECPGESAYLAAELTTALVEGMQGGAGGGDPSTHAGAVLKHLAGQGDYAGGRNSGSSPIGPRELAEVHLPPCLAGVRAGAAGFMAAYDDLDGIPCVAHAWLLTTLLREEWGYEGLVMGDALAVDRLAETMGGAAAARAALHAGLDANMGDECWAQLASVAGPGDDLDADLARAAGRVLDLKARFGLLPGQVDRLPPAPDRAVLAGLSGRLARESLTLVHGALPPIDAGQRVVVTGPHAGEPGSLLGDYVSPSRPGTVPSLADVLTSRFDARVVAWDAPRLVEEAQDADVVVVQIGGTSERRPDATFRDTGASATTAATCGEGVDIADLALPGGQDERLDRLRAATDARLVAVAVMGRPHVLTGAVQACDDVVLAWYPGPFGGEAIADLLEGTVRPTGRTPVTLLRHGGVVPWHDDDRVGRLEPGYVDVADPVLVPLAGGLSRTPVTLRADLQRRDGEITVAVDVEPGPASEQNGLDLVVHAFVRREGLAIWPRRRELLRFERVPVATGRVLTWRLGENEALAGAPTCVISVPAARTSWRLHRGEPAAHQTFETGDHP